ncbi:MAG: carboxypeptidase-like regulatory domain-containing protein [Terracidiphilus sp.]
MAEATREWIGTLVLAMLMAGAGAMAWAQTAGTAGENGAAPAASQSPEQTPHSDSNSNLDRGRDRGRGRALGRAGSISGRLTDLGSTPLAGATVVARNEATGAEAQTITAKNGSYRLNGLEAGLYTLEASSPVLGHGQLRGVYVAGGGYEARVQAAMALAHDLPGAPAVAPAPAGQLAATARNVPEPPGPNALIAPVRPVRPESGRKEAAEKGLIATNDPETHASAAEARVDPTWLPQGLKPPPMSQIATPQGANSENISRGLKFSAPSVPGSCSNSIPQAERDSVTAEIAAAPAEPVREMALAGRPVLAEASVRMTVESANAIAAIASEPMLRLGLSGRDAPGALAATTSMQPPTAPPSQSSPTVGPGTLAVVTTMAATELQSLPASGRRWQDFLLDTPTAGTVAGERSGDSLRAAGQLPPDTSIDEMTTRLAFGGSGSSGPQSSGPGSNGQGGREENGMASTWAGGHGSPVAEAAIHEVQTEAGNAEAEGIRNAGGEVNVDTTRGTNGLHGQGFLFDRQNTWGAQNPFTQWVKQTAPATLSTTPTFTAEPYTPPDHETVWGVGVGSQIQRDKLFWFAAVDSYNRNDPGLATVKHPAEFFAQPSNDQMQVLSARLELSSLNPVAEGLGAYSQMLTTLDGLLGPAPRTAAQWVGFTRIDWAATERHRFTLEATGARWNSPGGGLTRVSETYGANSFGSSQASEYLLLGRWEAFLTPNLLTVTQGSMGRTIQSAHPDTPSSYEQTLLSGNTWGQLPQIVVDSRYGFTLGNPSRFGMGSYPDEHLLEAREEVSWVHGNLLVKGGLELSHNGDATSLLRNETGTYSYSSAENFASDALVFAAYGLAGQENPNDQHNCDQTGKVWRDATGTLHGLGYLPCYSYYSQTLGPTNWNLSTNDWAGFTTVQWQPRKLLVISGGLRLEKEQLPPTIAALNNAELALTEKLPQLGFDWGPRISVALGSKENRWPVLRLGYGLYFGRTENATLETALTQTGSLKGDLNFFMRPTDNLNAGGAPPFPAVLIGPPGSVIKPGAQEFAPSYRNPEVHQAVASLEEELPGHIEVSAAALVSLGRRLPVRIDANIDSPTPQQTVTYNVCDQTPVGVDNGQCGNLGLGPIKATQITVPFYASWPAGGATCPFYAPTSTDVAGWLCPDYQQIDQFTSKANSTYEAMLIKVARYGRHGISLHAHYTYAHAMDWNPDESPLNPDTLSQASSFKQEYGTSNLDMRTRRRPW